MYSEEIIQGVKDHAMAHYEDGGWDVVVECYTDDEIVDYLERHATYPGCEPVTDVAGAVAAFEDVVSVWADRQADAKYHRDSSVDPEDRW